jgi:hypothetical protein
LAPLGRAHALTNLITNGDFELGPAGIGGANNPTLGQSAAGSGWVVEPYWLQGDYEIQSQIVHSGHYAIELISRSTISADNPVLTYTLPVGASTPQVHEADDLTFSVYFVNDTAATTFSLALYNVTKPAVTYNGATAIPKQRSLFYLNYYITNAKFTPPHQKACYAAIGRCWNGTNDLGETFATYVIQQPADTWITIDRNISADLRARNITASQLTYMNETRLLTITPEPTSLPQIQYYDDIAVLVEGEYKPPSYVNTQTATSNAPSPQNVTVDMWAFILIIVATCIVTPIVAVIYVVHRIRRSPKKHRWAIKPEAESTYIIGEHELKELIDDKEKEERLVRENERLTRILEDLERENARLRREGKPTIPTADPYVILAIPETATRQEIQNAYRRLATIYHPDMSRNPKSAEMFELITDAYNRLIGGG